MKFTVKMFSLSNKLLIIVRIFLFLCSRTVFLYYQEILVIQVKIVKAD